MMKLPKVLILTCIVLCFAAIQQARGALKPSNILLQLAEQGDEIPLNVSARREAFPALAQLPADLGCVFALSSPHKVASDFAHFVGEDAGFSPENVYSCTGIAVATSSKGLVEWMNFIQFLMNEAGYESLSELYKQILSPENQEILAKHERGQVPTSLPLGEPLYLTASFDSTSTEGFEKLYTILTESAEARAAMLSGLGLPTTVKQTEHQTIFTVDLKKCREKSSSPIVLHAWAQRIPQDVMHILITRIDSQLHLIITPELEKVKLPVQIQNSLLAAPQLSFLTTRLHGQPYAMLWADAEAVLGCSPMRPFHRELAIIADMLRTLSEGTKDEVVSGLYKQGSLALQVVTRTFFNMIPDMEYEFSGLIWSDGALHADISTGIGELHQEGTLRQLDLANDSQTAFYVEGSPFAPREAGMGIVKYTMNAYHVMEGIATSLNASSQQKILSYWDGLRYEYFPVIVQCTTGIRDIVRGMGTAAGLQLRLAEKEEDLLDYYAFSSVDQFAPLSSGWSQVLASFAKLSEIKDGRAHPNGLYQGVLGVEPNSIHYTRTSAETSLMLPPHADITAHYASIGTHSQENHAKRGERIERPFNGSVYLMRFAPLYTILSRAGWSLDQGTLLQKLADRDAVLYGVNVQRQGKLRMRLMLTAPK